MLPESVTSFLNEAAEQARITMPGRDVSLFLTGVLDSFSLVDFVTVIESECGVKVDDADLRPENFDTLAKVEEFIARANRSK